MSCLNLYDRIKALGYKIIVTEKAKDFICDKGWDAQFGARPLKRAIQKYIEDALAEEIIKTKLVTDDIINIDYDEDSTSIKIVSQNRSLLQKRWRSQNNFHVTKKEVF